MSVRVKICGITREEDALAAVHQGAHAIGFVFWEHSARYIAPVRAHEIIDILPPFVTAVGIYVNPSTEWVKASSSIAGLNLLQFHGDEPAAFCSQFALPYIKGIRVRKEVDLLQYAACHPDAKGLLLDTYIEGEPGGTGHAFDWNLLPQNLPLPVILSGGLHAGNVIAAIRQVKPWAVDVSSGVERAKGIKDMEKIAVFMQGVRNSESV
jgi:phosphoribosylanthranilate isomerase